ncbi:MAG: methyltransferase domain-containing protein, partial [Rhizomicrobium sp.]
INPAGMLPRRLALARGMADRGDMKSALDCAREAALQFPEDFEAALLLGELLMRADLLPSAIGELQRALDLEPESNRVHYLLGSAWLQAGEAERALSFFAEVDEDTPGRADKISKAERILSRPRSDAAYVRHLFNYFSSNYDSHMLSQLQYQAPAALRQLFDMVAPGAATLDLLDLGCGTGLGGAAFRDVVRHMVGVDLSPRMLDQARKRGQYQSLILADIERPVIAENSFDLVLAADALVYLGELDKVLATAMRALRSGGHFLFTVEKKTGEGYELGPKRRWRHSESYLRRAADLSGFDLVGIIACEPRNENAVPVAGFAVALQKPTVTTGH